MMGKATNKESHHAEFDRNADFRVKECHVCRVALGGHRDPVEVVRGLSILVQAGGAVHCTLALYMHGLGSPEIGTKMERPLTTCMGSL